MALLSSSSSVPASVSARNTKCDGGGVLDESAATWLNNVTSGHGAITVAAALSGHTHGHSFRKLY